MTSDLDEVMYVNNPIEAGLPGHWVPLSVIKKVIEMRASAVNYWTTPRKVKLKHFTVPLSLYKTIKNKHKATSKHKFITTFKYTNSLNDLTGKSIKIEPEILNKIEKKAKGTEDVTIASETTIDGNKVLNVLQSSPITITSEIYNKTTDSTTTLATTNKQTTTVSIKETVEVTNRLDTVTTTFKTTKSTSTLSPPELLPKTSTSEDLTSILTTSALSTITTVSSKPITTATTLRDNSESTTSVIVKTTDTSEPTTISTVMTLDTSAPTTSTTVIITDTSEATTSATVITDTSEPTTSTTVTLPETSEQTTTTPIITSTQSTLTTVESSEVSDTGNPFY